MTTVARDIVRRGVAAGRRVGVHAHRARARRHAAGGATILTVAVDQDCLLRAVQELLAVGANTTPPGQRPEASRKGTGRRCTAAAGRTRDRSGPGALAAAVPLQRGTAPRPSRRAPTSRAVRPGPPYAGQLLLAASICW